MSKVLTHNSQRLWVKLGADELDRDWRFRLLGKETKRRFSEAFIATIQTEQVNRNRFRFECKMAGISPALIFLFASILWDVFWHWWTHRDDA